MPGVQRLSFLINFSRMIIVRPVNFVLINISHLLLKCALLIAANGVFLAHNVVELVQHALGHLPVNELLFIEIKMLQLVIYINVLIVLVHMLQYQI